MAKIVAPDINPSVALFWMIDHYLPIGIKGILIAGLLAVIMSTADSWLNTASILLSHDIIAKIFPKFSQGKELVLARTSIVFIGIGSVFLALNYSAGMLNLGWLSGNAWKPIVLIPLLSGFLSFYTSTTSFVISCICGVLGIGIGFVASGELATVSWLTGIIGSAIGFFGAHFIQLMQGRLQPNKVDAMSKNKTSVVSVSNVRNLGFLQSFLVLMDKEVEKEGKNYYLASGIGIICFLCGLLLNGPSGITTAVIKMTSAFMCIILFFHERLILKNHHQKYLSLYYCCTLMVTFPVVSGYTLYLSGWDMAWIFNFVIAVIIVHFLAGPWIAIFTSLLGLLIAWYIFDAFNSYQLFHGLPSFTYIAFMFMMLVLAARLRYSLTQEQMYKREYYAKMMAHQMMHPISQTKMMGECLGGILHPYQEPTILEDGTKCFIFKQEDMAEIKSIVEYFVESSKSNEKVVRGLLNMIRDDIEKVSDVGIYDIDECVIEALSSYNAHEKARINVISESSFKFKGSKILMIEVVRNLITNAFKYAGNKATITICYSDNKLYFKDNGVGIDADNIPTIFDRFYNGQMNGMGLGLSFCKRVMEAFHGDIECDSVKGSYTQFILSFQKI